MLIETAYVGVASERLPERAAELVRLKVEVIVVLGTSAVLAAQRVTTGPIVSVSGDPVAQGWRGASRTPAAT